MPKSGWDTGADDGNRPATCSHAVLAGVRPASRQLDARRGPPARSATDPPTGLLGGSVVVVRARHRRCHGRAWNPSGRRAELRTPATTWSWPRHRMGKSSTTTARADRAAPRPKDPSLYLSPPRRSAHDQFAGRSRRWTADKRRPATTATRRWATGLRCARTDGGCAHNPTCCHRGFCRSTRDGPGCVAEALRGKW